jgi:hypothetical protein
MVLKVKYKGIYNGKGGVPGIINRAVSPSVIKILKIAGCSILYLGGRGKRFYRAQLVSDGT